MPSPSSLTYIFQRAEVHYRAGRVEQAQKLYRTILKVVPTQPLANSRLGAMLLQRNQPEQSIPYFERALRAQPQQIQHWSQLITALQCSGQQQRARQLLEQADETVLTMAEIERLRRSLNDPPELVQRHLIGLYQCASKLTVEIAAHLFINDYPDHLVGWQVLSEVLHDTGRLIESLELKQDLALRCPTDVNVQANLARTQIMLGQYEAALLSARCALQINPAMPEALRYEKQALQTLKLPAVPAGDTLKFA
ncbi:MAG: tetratricopeptide repeat protein [Rhodoferax sp.]|nr:tetratricopeptide repeat protein [Rhodoferax sp.]